MKKYFRYSKLTAYTLLLCMLFTTSLAEEKRETLSPKKALNNVSIRELFQSVHLSETGEFTQQRHLSALNAPLKSSGYYTLIKNNALTWHIQSPFEIKYHYDGKTLTQTEFGETHSISLKDDPSLVGFFSFFFEILNGDGEQLEKHLKLKHLDTEEKSSTYHFTPKKGFLKKAFHTLNITANGIATESQSIQRVEIIETGGDTLALSFQPSPPEATTQIENRRPHSDEPK